MFGMMNGGKGGGNQLQGGMGQNPGLASLFANNQAVNRPGAMQQLAPITAPVRPQFAPPPRIPLPQAAAPVAAQASAPRPWMPGQAAPLRTNKDGSSNYANWRRWATNRAGG